jgi:hypothetical protein
MRRYIEPADPEHRPLLRTYAEAMPARLGPQLLEILRGVGLDVAPFTRDSGDVDVSAALDAFEAVEQKLARRRSAELVAELESNGTDPITLRESHRLIERLAQLDPAAIEANADFVIEVLSVSAEQFRDSPLDRERALSRLEKLPFGARETDAKRVAEMTRARLEYGDGDGSAALARLEALDPELAQAEVRALWVELMHDVFAQHLRDGLFDAATRLLDAAESLAPQEVDVPELRRRLQWRRHRTAMIVGAAFGLVFLCSIALLVGRAIKAGLTRWRKAKREMDLLIRRQEDADASAEDAVDLEGDEPRQDADAPAADAPEPEDAPPEEETPLEDCALSWEGREPFGDCFERDGLTDVFDAWSDDAVEEPVSGAKLVS